MMNTCISVHISKVNFKTSACLFNFNQLCYFSNCIHFDENSKEVGSQIQLTAQKSLEPALLLNIGMGYSSGENSS